MKTGPQNGIEARLKSRFRKRSPKKRILNQLKKKKELSSRFSRWVAELERATIKGFEEGLKRIK